MIETLRHSASLQAFCDKIVQSSIVVEHLWNMPKAVLIALARHATQKNILFISSNNENHVVEGLSSLLSSSVWELPPWETLPHEEASPSLDITGRRLSVLFHLMNSASPVVLHAPLQAVLQKTIPPSQLATLCRVLRKGESVSFTACIDLLLQLGYTKCPLASDKGQFAVRGGIIDFFPSSACDPYRIDFFGDTIDTIRSYDAISQRSIGYIDELLITPSSEKPLLPSAPYLATIFDYLGPQTLVMFDDLFAIEDQYLSLRSLSGMQGKYVYSLEQILKDSADKQTIFFFQHNVETLSQVKIHQPIGREFYAGNTPFQEISFDFFYQPFSAFRYHHPFVSISQFFSSFDNQAAATKEEILLGIHHLHTQPIDLYFFCRTQAEESALQTLISEQNISLPQRTSFHQGYLPSGFVIQDTLCCYLPYTELSHRRHIQRPPWRHSYHNEAVQFHQLIPGEIVVHTYHGIGRFIGIQTKKDHLGHVSEYFEIAYAKGSSLFVPLEQSHLITRYIGVQEENPTLHVLGSQQWHRTYTKTAQSIIGYAKELLQRAAVRASTPGHAFPQDTEAMLAFEEDFPFPETDDQIRAIIDIKQDMTSSQAMDRLLCGDVGYGKTEVAMRAAFKAAYEGGKQVAVLAPTTLLALQHYETFCERMESFPLRIAHLSRFSSSQQIKQTLEGMRTGTIDIVIGTHRLASKDVSFANLGLLIIDEEQRFGVRAKEHIKQLQANVDCLTLSATPIPRTLYMSLIGMRPISTINTPPRDRLPIKSMIAPRQTAIIEQAILREFARGGQVFFIHNHIDTLDLVRNELQKIAPQARIVMGHGQMNSSELDQVFTSFQSGKADLLLSTTIIENGIDIPNANTILIDRADTFGMADLYQLRGRVGRWNRTAYAYFLVPNPQALPDIAKQRLQTLATSSGYGGGMKIAMKDLELRGAGDILGVHQSGQVAAIGFHLYCKMLKKAISSLQQQQPIQFADTKLEFVQEAYFPHSYIADASVRMELYHRLGNATTSEEITALQQEIQDRFGVPPRSVLLLCSFFRIKIQASALGCLSLHLGRKEITIEKQSNKAPKKHSFLLPSLVNLQEFEKQVLQHIAHV